MLLFFFSFKLITDSFIIISVCQFLKKKNVRKITNLEWKGNLISYLILTSRLLSPRRIMYKYKTRFCLALKIRDMGEQDKYKTRFCLVCSRSEIWENRINTKQGSASGSRSVIWENRIDTKQGSASGSRSEIWENEIDTKLGKRYIPWPLSWYRWLYWWGIIVLSHRRLCSLYDVHT